MNKKIKGFTLIEILIIAGIAGLILTLLVISLNSKQKDIRDTKRLKDVYAVRDAMEVVKNQTGSYERTYCELGFVSLCYQKDNSELLKILPELRTLNDPRYETVACQLNAECAKGCNYSFTTLEPDNYEVLFSLEKGVGIFSQSGCYRLTPQGISKL